MYILWEWKNMKINTVIGTCAAWECKIKKINAVIVACVVWECKNKEVMGACCMRKQESENQHCHGSVCCMEMHEWENQHCSWSVCCMRMQKSDNQYLNDISSRLTSRDLTESWSSRLTVIWMSTPWAHCMYKLLMAGKQTYFLLSVLT